MTTIQRLSNERTNNKTIQFRFISHRQFGVEGKCNVWCGVVWRGVVWCGVVCACVCGREEEGERGG